MSSFRLLSQATRLPEEPEIQPHHTQIALKPSRFTWDGVIVVREWDSAFTEEDYLLMLAGGTARRWRERDNAPSALILPDRLARQAQRDLDAHCTRKFEYHNVACNTGRTVILNLTANLTASYSGLNVFAVGNSSVTPAATDVQLGNEIFRKSISNIAVSGSQLDANTFFGTSEGNFAYTEAGIFGNGADPTLTNDGTLFAHAPFIYTKTNSVTLTTDYFIQLL